MILLYAHRLTPRLRYIASLVLTQLLGLHIRFTEDKQEFLRAKTKKINYSRTPLQSGLYLESANLLFETDIFEQSLKSKKDGDEIPLLFLSSARSHLPFDPFAASFYLVSRYEEYIPFISDKHNRFPARESIQYKLDALHLPLVNVYAEKLGECLKEHYPSIQLHKPRYRFLNTIDIDNASAYLGKGVFRVAASYLRDLVTFNYREAWERSLCLLGFKSDPFETFDYVQQLQEQYGFQSLYFALFGRLGQYDRSLSRYSVRLQRYIKGIADFAEVGIHPSYRSNLNPAILAEELRNLELVLRKDVDKSRQHFLKLHFPTTYRNLLELEITDDYSMGFAEVTGFRAGICTPFTFYDLELEQETRLRIHPFPFMEGTYMYYLKYQPEEAWEDIQHYLKIYRRYGGFFTPVWHNRVFSEKEPEWKGWRQVFEQMIAAAI